MQQPLDIGIKTYKKRALPTSPKPNSIYYILPVNSTAVVVYVTDVSGIPIKVIDLTGGIGNIASVTGTGVTGTSSNPRIDISSFVSAQIDNRIQLSILDGKLQVNPITSPNSSISVSATSTELQLQLSASILSQINSALQSGDNISQLTNDVGYVTATGLPNSTSILREEFEYLGGAQNFTLLNNYYQVFSVEVQGQGALSLSQYNLIAPNTIQILDTLSVGDYVVILYGRDLIISAAPYYTQAQIDNKLQVIGDISFLNGVVAIDFGAGSTSSTLTIPNITVTNSNIVGYSFIPQETVETDLNDFSLNKVTFNIENIIDNTSFTIRGTSINTISGNYTIKYLITKQ
jgi:hypothetical protein